MRGATAAGWDTQDDWNQYLSLSELLQGRRHKQPCFHFIHSAGQQGRHFLKFCLQIRNRFIDDRRRCYWEYQNEWYDMWSHKMLLRQLKLQETRVKRRKEGVGESEEGARESVLSDDPPDSKYLFIYQNYRLPQIPSWCTSYRIFPWMAIHTFSVKCLRPKSTSNVQVPDWSSRGASPCARQWLGPCRSPEVSLQSPSKGKVFQRNNTFSNSLKIRWQWAT